MLCHTEPVVATSPMKLGSLCKRKNIRGNCLRIRYVEDKLLLVVLEAVENLINTCSVELLEKIARELSVASLICLKDIWAKMQDLVSECSDQEGRDTWSSIKPPDLAEMVFRLSMNHCCHTTCTSDTIKRSIFGPEESNIVNFILNNWEVSPVLLSMRSKTSKENDSIFSFLTKCFNGKTIDYILDSILGRLVSCPPIASDELSILNFLEEVRGRLGCPIVYGQDLRVIKTVGPSKKEVHFWDNSVVFSIDNDCVEGCKEAYHNGYTIALRGMEFRTEKVAAIADGLEMLLGQLSVGANVYLTPPRSQGLARHCDDHCVFVCQLLGKKKWAVFPQSIQLPRLYDPLGSVLGSEGGNDGCESKQFLLREGDVLYIPRGCPHEAHTVTGDSESQIDEASEFSLHLTLGIEVEPPFEWEGFAHIALHCWNENRKHTTDDLIKSKLQIPSDYFINLLHVAIRVIGDHDTTFRKACMVAAFAFLSDSRGKQNFHSLIMSQRATFSYVINKINAESSFLEAFKVIEVSVLGRNDESLQWMRWLRHLPQEGVADEKMDFNDPLKLFENLVLSYNGDVNDAHAAFLHVKSEFCTSVIFEEASRSFGLLLKKYKKTRKHYMNGMLSLH